MDTFKNLALAFEALQKAGNMPCILNAANEIAVEKFLNDKIRFIDMPDLIADCLAKTHYIPHPTLEDYIQTDQATRQLAQDWV
jgi:1-deoxy-D-xylulose-5-phosphate reductoisomerase